MTMLLAWAFLAFAVERLVELVLKMLPFIDKSKISQVDIGMALALLLSSVLAFGANLDFFKMFEIEFSWPYVGPAISALFMTGGSQLVHDITEWVKANKDFAKSE
jgi:hypothetical protein